MSLFSSSSNSLSPSPHPQQHQPQSQPQPQPQPPQPQQLQFQHHLHSISPPPSHPVHHNLPHLSPQYNERVNAVFTKDSNQTSAFVYIVKPSNTFCRPDCDLTRVIDQSSLLFFDSSKEASANGFKPCNNCKPDLEMKVENHVIDSTVNTVNASLGLDLSQQSSQQQQPRQVLQVQVQDITGTIDPSSSDANATYILPSSDQSHTPDFSSPIATRHFRSLSSVGNQDFIIPTTVDKEGWRPRRASIASGHIPAVLAAVTEMTKTGGAISGANIVLPNSAILTTQSTPHGRSSRRDRADGERDHHRLVDEACRHIAAAAAASAAAAAAAAVANSEDESITTSSRARSRKGRATSESSRSASNSISGASSITTTQSIRSQRKKRRGGILGFKELAAKAGLSPWHFHRVFRSVTGLTPKAYGEACWNAVTANPTVPVEIVENNKPNNEKSAAAMHLAAQQSSVTLPAQPQPLPTQQPILQFNQPFSLLENQYEATTSEPDINAMNMSVMGYDMMNNNPHHSVDQMDPLDPLGPTRQFLVPTTANTTNGSPMFSTATTTATDPAPFLPNSWEGMMPMGFNQDSPSLTMGSTSTSVQNTPNDAYPAFSLQQSHAASQPPQIELSPQAFLDDTTSTPPSRLATLNDFSMNDLLTTIEATPSILATTTNLFPTTAPPGDLEYHSSDTAWVVDVPSFTETHEDSTGGLLKHDNVPSTPQRDWVYISQST